VDRRLLIVIAVALVVVGIVATSALFIVDQTEQALVLQFGQPRRVIREPGLWVKRPFLEDVRPYDNRLLDFEPPPEEVIVSDQKRLVVDTYTRYRITDPLLFYQTANSEVAVRARLSAMVNGSLRRVLGNVASMSSMSASAAPTCPKRTARRFMLAWCRNASNRRLSFAARVRRRRRRSGPMPTANAP